MTADSWFPDEPDELDRRYRSLEAERLRPVPSAFAHGKRQMAEDLAAIKRRREVLELLEIEDENHDEEPE